jgi:hypothetical protein
MIICKNGDTGEIVKFKNIKAVLRNINRDRSQDWTPYNKHDWREGLREFTEFDLIKVLNC